MATDQSNRAEVSEHFVIEVNVGLDAWSRRGSRSTLEAAIRSADRNPLFGSRGVRLPTRIVKETIGREVVHRVWP